MASSDEAMLSAQERAALARIEARAAADDPRFADHLRGGQLRRRAPGGLPDSAWITTAISHGWASIRPAVGGPLLTVAGLVLTVLGLAVNLAVGVVGVVMTAAGLILLSDLVRQRVLAARADEVTDVLDAD